MPRKTSKNIVAKYHETPIQSFTFVWGKIQVSGALWLLQLSWVISQNIKGHKNECLMINTVGLLTATAKSLVTCAILHGLCQPLIMLLRSLT